ncbi:MAG: NADH-quinone oxidoreductase subunit J [Elusimicrobia bacterium]|nr:NADH-quinone oxidoreductase subunit J [Elusimicrobiota bacterium]
MIEQIAFYSLAAVTLVAALLVVTLRNVLHSALSLGLCLFGVAGIFATLGADFVAASQVLVYVGGIALLVLFVVLLAARHSELVLRQTNQQWAAGLFIAGATLWGMSRYIAAYRGLSATTEAHPTTRDIAQLLLKDLAVPFELISLVLLVALAGAILYSHQGKEEGPADAPPPAGNPDPGPGDPAEEAP